MESPHHALTHEHHHLLLEEMMLLTVGSKFTCTVSANHYFLNQVNPMSLIRKCLQTAPTRLLLLERKVYFTFNLVVTSNLTYEHFKLGTLGSTDEISHQCTKREGAGLNCVLQATGKPMLIKFHHLIDHPLSIMFWSAQNLMGRSSVITRKLKDCKDITRMKAMGMRYSQEYCSDAASIIEIVNHIHGFVRDLEAASVTKVINDLEIFDRAAGEGKRVECKQSGFYQLQKFC